MKKSKTLLKKMWMLLAILFCSVISAQAATINYSLTTHVDGRTMNEAANVATGASLEDNMPQALWRAYTTYKFYADPELTKEITEAPAEDATVYVDYEFDPPFLMSKEGADPIWNYLRSYNSDGQNNYIVYYKQANESNWGTYKQTIMGWKSTSGRTPTVGNNNAMSKAGHDQWAFYGDAYDFQIRLNDSSIANNYLIWRHTSRNETPMGLGAKPEVGWQLYVNTATNNKITSGTVAMGPYNTTNYLASLENVNSCLWTDGLTTSEQYFDSHNQLVYKVVGSSQSSQTTMNRKGLWWYAFFASPVTSSAATTDIWHVTYKIQKADGSWYDDIVVQKSSSNLKPSFPPAGFTPVEGCTYDYFYLDANFTEKCAENYTMPNDCNTTLYIKEAAEPIEYLTNEPWKTLVIPFTIANLQEYFGEDYEGVPAVDVLEFKHVQDGVITEAATEDFYRCHLIFDPVETIEAYKPYLFRVNRTDKRVVDALYSAEGSGQCEVITVDDPDNENISVSMEGTLASNGFYMDASDGLHFYFGYNDRNDTYNFYRVSAIIPRNRCWFYVNDNRPSGAKLNVTFDMNAVTGISQTVVSAKAADGKIYNINGQQVQNTLQKGIYIVNGKKVIVK